MRLVWKCRNDADYDGQGFGDARRTGSSALCKTVKSPWLLVERQAQIKENSYQFIQARTVSVGRIQKNIDGFYYNTNVRYLLLDCQTDPVIRQPFF
jgi:hypothetical protein